jgi:hypothetical protein
MKRFTLHASRFTLVTLLFVGVGLARPLHVWAGEVYDPNTVPFEHDPNAVVGTLLGTVTQRAGVAGTVKGSYWDPDGDPVIVALMQAPAGMEIANDPNQQSYSLAWLPVDEGVYPVVLSATDVPASGTPLTAVGTILWRVLPANRQPMFHGIGDVVLMDH